MSKVRFTDDSFRREPWFRSLCQALLSCKTEEQMGDLLRDVGTLSELQAWSERLEVARQLVKGLSYRQVAKNTGASTTTVTRVAKFIENGPGGYRRFLHAHRHHRIHPAKDASEMQNNPPAQNIDRPKPQSPLQKYLQK